MFRWGHIKIIVCFRRAVIHPLSGSVMHEARTPASPPCGSCISLSTTLMLASRSAKKWAVHLYQSPHRPVIKVDFVLFVIRPAPWLRCFRPRSRLFGRQREGERNAQVNEMLERFIVLTSFGFDHQPAFHRPSGYVKRFGKRN